MWVQSYIIQKLFHWFFSGSTKANFKLSDAAQIISKQVKIWWFLEYKFLAVLYLNYHMSYIVIIQYHIIAQSNWHLQSGCILKQDNPGIVKNCLPKQLWLSPKLQQKSQLSPTRMSIITSSKYCLRYQLLHRKLLNHKGNQTCYHLIIHQLS